MASDEAGIDALCDLLHDEMDNDLSPQPIPSLRNDSTTIPESKFKAEDSDTVSASLAVVTKPACTDSRKKFQLTESPVDLFATPTSDSDTMSNEMKEIGMVTNEDEEVNPYIQTPQLMESGRNIQALLNKNVKSYDGGHKFRKSKILELPKKAENTTDHVETDNFSNVRIINRLVSSTTLKEKMKGRKMVPMSTMQSHIQGRDIAGDWVTIGVIIHKSDTKTSKNGKNFSIWKLSDLNDCDKIVKLFLFGEVHKQHWKATTGSVIGILNATIMESKDSVSGEVCITVDNYHKIMLIGVSKDFGFCKAKCKDGTPCSIVVNKHKCEYCKYHVKSAYQKLSSKRTELQSAFSGVEPRGLKNKLFKNQHVMYGGQSYSTPSNKVGSNKRIKEKNKMILSNLGMQKKVEDVVAEEKARAYINKDFSQSEKEAINGIAKVSKNLHEMMTGIPSPGSRNLLQHLVKEDKKQQVKAGTFKSISAKDLLKMHQSKVLNRKIPTNKPSSCSPRIGAGLSMGVDIDLDIPPSANSFNSKNTLNGAKLRAIKKIQRKGDIPKTNPNAVRVNKNSEGFQGNIKRRVGESSSTESEHDSPKPKRSCLEIDRLSGVDVKKVMNQRSSHENEANVEVAERLENYFGTLEKKEQMEEKMTSTKEIIVTAVSCRKCKYTAYHQSDFCRELQHITLRHQAKKRFFKCVNCKKRTTSLAKLPTKACRFCNGSSFERVGMWEEKTKENDKLFITDEQSVPYNSDCE